MRSRFGKYIALLCMVLLWSCGSKPKTNQEDAAQEPLERPTIGPDQAIEEQPDKKEDDQRTEWQNPELVLNLLGELENKVVADVGAGSGYFTFKIAREAKKVIALDIDPNALEYIEGQKEIVGSWADNIETRLTPADVPNLVENEVDIVLIVNTYAYIPNKQQYLPRLKKGMRSGARLVIVDFKTGEIPVGPSDDTKVDAKEVIRSLNAAGFSQTKSDLTSLQYQYIITATK